LELPKIDGNAVLLNSLLLDATEGQINVVQWRNANGRFAIRTAAGKTTAEIEGKWLLKSNGISEQSNVGSGR
jgi:hypothetical protein